MTEDLFLDLKRLAERSSICERNLRAFIKDKKNPLPYYTPGGKILIRWPEFCEWMAQFRKVQKAKKSKVDTIVDELV